MKYYLPLTLYCIIKQNMLLRQNQLLLVYQQLLIIIEKKKYQIYQQSRAMRSTMLFVLTCLTIVMSTTARFYTYYDIPMPPSYQKFQYSRDGRLLAIVSESKVYIYNGQTGNNIYNITVPSDSKISSFAFSQSSTLLAIGFENSKVTIYKYQQINNTFQQINTNIFDQIDHQSITTLCFTIDNSKLVIGLYLQNIVLWNFIYNVITYQSLDNLYYINSISCSPIDQSIFVVGSYQSLTGYLYFYQSNNQSNSIQLLHYQTFHGAVFDTCFSGNYLYYVKGTNGGIYYCDLTNNYTIYTINQNKTLGLKISQIEVSSNNRLIAINYGTTVALFIDQILVDELQVSKSTFALTFQGGYLFLAVLTGQGINYAQCQRGTYSDNNGNCLFCHNGCNICFKSQVQCYDCTSRYFLSNQQCLRCIPGCYVCNSTQTCLNCSTEFINDDGICECSQAYFQINDTCMACMDYCQQCLIDINCTKCYQGFIISNNTCLCQEGHYIFDSKTCLPCERGCQTCQNSQSCTSCNQTGHYVPNGTICVCDSSKHFVDDNVRQFCVCQDGFYLLIDICLNCPDKCQTCTSDTACQSCISPDLEPETICQQCIDKNSFFNETQNQCQYCSIPLDFCMKCDNSTVCLYCFNWTNRQPQNGTCKCISGFWQDDNKICKLCSISIPGCTICLNQTICQECDSSNHWTLNKTSNICGCQIHYFNSNNSCQQCIIGCNICTNSTTCNQCNQTGHWISDQNSQCKCQISYFINNDTCNKCIIGCLYCNQQSSCFQCNHFQNFQIQNISHTCICKTESFLNESQICELCMIGCINCTQRNACITCDQQQNFEMTDNGTCQCKQQYFLNTTTNCQPCIFQCLLCNSSQTCSKCKPRYFLINQSCQHCMDNCLSCFSKDDCQLCDDSFIVVNSLCACPQKKYEDNNTCKSCNEKCKTCASFNKCDSCEDGYTLKDDACNENGPNTLLIAILVGGGVLLFIIIVVGGLCIKKRKQKLRQNYNRL